MSKKKSNSGKKKTPEVSQAPLSFEDEIKKKIYDALDRNISGKGIASIQAAKLYRDMLNEGKSTKSNAVHKIKWVNIESDEEGKIIEEQEAMPVIEKEKPIENADRKSSSTNN